MILNFERRKKLLNRVQEVLNALNLEILEYSIFLEETTICVANHRLKEIEAVTGAILVNQVTAINWRNIPIDLHKFSKLKRYSPYNVFAWIKRFRKKERSIAVQRDAYLEKFGYLLEMVVDLQTDVLPLLQKKKNSGRLVDMLEELHTKICTLEGLLEIDPLENKLRPELFDLFFSKWTLTKNDFLSILTLDRNKVSFHHKYDEKKVEQHMKFNDLLHSLPEKISSQLFFEIISSYSLEDPLHAYFFDIAESIILEAKFEVTSTTTAKSHPQ